MTDIRLHVTKIFDGQNYAADQVLTIRDGVIIDIDENITQVDISLQGLVVPGYIDLQVNGGGGALFNDAPTLSSIQTMMKAHSQFGTTAMLPTLITDNIEVMSEAADAIAMAIAEQVPGILGVHFEGPHLSVAKKGAHAAQYIRPISEHEWEILSRKDLGQILVTLAPETVTCEEIERLVLWVLRCLWDTVMPTIIPRRWQLMQVLMVLPIFSMRCRQYKEGRLE
jgi:N-acetylglucosamine-6-phosphate deacetylase